MNQWTSELDCSPRRARDNKHLCLFDFECHFCYLRCLGRAKQITGIQILFCCSNFSILSFDSHNQFKCFQWISKQHRTGICYAGWAEACMTMYRLCLVMRHQHFFVILELLGYFSPGVDFSLYKFPVKLWWLKPGTENCIVRYRGKQSILNYSSQIHHLSLSHYYVTITWWLVGCQDSNGLQ